jgi:hypothetical protein
MEARAAFETGRILSDRVWAACPDLQTVLLVWGFHYVLGRKFLA